MPRPKQQRKAAAVTTPTSMIRKQQRGIQAFGKISKVHSESQSLGKRKVVDLVGIEQEDFESAKKRRCKTVVEVTSSKPPTRTSQLGTDTLPSTSQQPRNAPLPEARIIKKATPRKKASTTLRLTETPTKGARSILESFSLNSSSPSTRSSSPPPSLATTPPTSPSSPRSATPFPSELPSELQDLLDLHSSFLSALSLHYAHHGCLTPVDLRELNPSVSRIWRRRSVTLEDIQRILGIAHLEQPTQGARRLCLTDFGDAKTCVEIADGLDNPGLHRRPIEEEVLHKQFTVTLEQQWQQYTISNTASTSTKTFIATLPLASTSPCDSLSKLSPLLAKGQRRLEDLKAGAIRAQKASSSPTSSAKEISTIRPKLAASRSDSLLSRIRAKELIQSTLPPPPSRTTLERKSALQRIAEVVPVLELLTAGSAGGEPFGGLDDPKRKTQTKAFTMPTLVENLKMSLRNPISSEDARRCVTLLAGIVPEWLVLKEVGSCTSVSVRKGGALGREEMRRRVDGAMQAL